MENSTLVLLSHLRNSTLSVHENSQVHCSYHNQYSILPISPQNLSKVLGILVCGLISIRTFFSVWMYTCRSPALFNGLSININRHCEYERKSQNLWIKFPFFNFFFHRKNNHLLFITCVRGVLILWGMGGEMIYRYIISKFLVFWALIHNYIKTSCIMLLTDDCIKFNKSSDWKSRLATKWNVFNRKFTLYDVYYRV